MRPLGPQQLTRGEARRDEGRMLSDTGVGEKGYLADASNGEQGPNDVELPSPPKKRGNDLLFQALSGPKAPSRSKYSIVYLFVNQNSWVEIAT